MSAEESLARAEELLARLEDPRLLSALARDPPESTPLNPLERVPE